MIEIVNRILRLVGNLVGKESAGYGTFDKISAVPGEISFLHTWLKVDYLGFNVNTIMCARRYYSHLDDNFDLVKNLIIPFVFCLQLAQTVKFGLRGECVPRTKISGLFSVCAKFFERPISTQVFHPICCVTRAV